MLQYDRNVTWQRTSIPTLAKLAPHVVVPSRSMDSDLPAEPWPGWDLACVACGAGCRAIDRFCSQCGRRRSDRARRRMLLIADDRRRADGSDARSPTTPTDSSRCGSRALRGRAREDDRRTRSKRRRSSGSSRPRSSDARPRRDLRAPLPHPALPRRRRDGLRLLRHRRVDRRSGRAEDPLRADAGGSRRVRALQARS